MNSISVKSTATQTPDYTPSERLLCWALDSWVRWRGKLAEVLHSKTGKGGSLEISDRPVRRFGRIVTACILLGLLFPPWVLLSLLSGSQGVLSAWKEIPEVLEAVYLFHRHYVFDDPSLFTTFSIGLIAGAISISALASASIEGRSRLAVADREAVRMWAIAFGSIAALVFLVQLAVTAGWFFWKDPSRGGLSPIIVAVCVVGFLVCAVTASLVSMPVSHLRRQLVRLREEVAELERELGKLCVEHRRLPLWNVRNLCTAAALTLGLIFTATIEILSPGASPAPIISGSLVAVVMAAICSLAYFQFSTVGRRNPFPLRRLISLNSILHWALTISFSSALAAVMSQGSDPKFLGYFICWLIAIRASLQIQRLDVVAERLKQAQQNEILYSIRVRESQIARKVESIDPIITRWYVGEPSSQ